MLVRKAWQLCPAYVTDIANSTSKLDLLSEAP